MEVYGKSTDINTIKRRDRGGGEKNEKSWWKNLDFFLGTSADLI